MAIINVTSEGRAVLSNEEESAYIAMLANAANLQIIRAREEMTVTRFQALAAMHNTGLLTSVQAIIDAPETSALVKLAWDNAQTFERTSPSILAIAQVLGLTDEQLDTLFTQASQIKA
jgi:predicted alternative tryptophan synthase beta-subunit